MSAQYCCICRCKVSNIHVRKVPRDAEKRKLWSDAAGFPLTEANRVCDLHFKESDFYTSSKRTRMLLLASAIPKALCGEKNSTTLETAPLVDSNSQTDCTNTSTTSTQYCSVCRCRVSNVYVRLAPKDKDTRKLWTDSTGVSLTESSKVCDLHFEDSDFYCTKQNKRRRLLPTAIPIGPIQETMPSESETTSRMVDASTQTLEEIVNAGLALENMRLQRLVSQLEKYNRQLEQRMKKVEDLNESVEKFFTQSQLQQLRNGGKKVEWNPEDITNGMSLHAAGPREYRHLLKKGFPLPCERTLQRWRKKLNAQCDN